MSIGVSIVLRGNSSQAPVFVLISFRFALHFLAEGKLPTLKPNY